MHDASASFLVKKVHRLHFDKKTLEKTKKKKISFFSAETRSFRPGLMPCGGRVLCFVPRRETLASARNIWPEAPARDVRTVPDRHTRRGGLLQRLRGWRVGEERQPSEGRNKSGVAVAAFAAGGPLGGDRAGGQGDGHVGEGCGVGAGVAARQGERFRLAPKNLAKNYAFFERGSGDRKKKRSFI